jgi:hypothetical protein
MATFISSPNPPSECDGVKKVRSPRPRLTIILGMLIAGGFLSALLSPFSASAQTGAPPLKEPAPAEEPPPVPTPPPATQPPTEQSRKAWHNAMVGVPLPKKGCFEAAYPSTEWREVPCTTPPRHPLSPARGPKPYTVGGGNDYSAQTPRHSILWAQGSFDSVTDVTNVTSFGVAGSYSLQLNTQFFITSFAGCSHGCRGWVQFVFENEPGLGGTALMQYWLLNYGIPCPAGWSSFNVIDCATFSLNVVSVPFQPIGNLANLVLIGNVNWSGDNWVYLATATRLYAANGDRYFQELGTNWRSAEFNIYGDCCSTTANFNYLATLVVRTSVFDGGGGPGGHGDVPSCVQSGTTAETNNLTLAAPCCSYGTEYGAYVPSIVFTESYPARASMCSGGTSVPGNYSGGSDIALVTFTGLLAVWSLARLCRHRRALQ